MFLRFIFIPFFHFLPFYISPVYFISFCSSFPIPFFFPTFFLYFFLCFFQKILLRNQDMSFQD
jgi:hypothetical protein